MLLFSCFCSIVSFPSQPFSRQDISTGGVETTHLLRTQAVLRRDSYSRFVGYHTRSIRTPSHLTHRCSVSMQLFVNFKFPRLPWFGLVVLPLFSDSWFQAVEVNDSLPIPSILLDAGNGIGQHLYHCE